MERKPYYGSGNRSSRPGAGRPGSASPSSARNQSSSRTRAQGSVRAGSRPSAQRTREGAAYRQSAQRSAANRTSRTASAARQAAGVVVRPSPPRRRKASLSARLIPLAMLAALLAGGIYVGSAWLVTRTNRSTYCDNIFINGIDVSSYGRAEGAAYVQSQVDARLSASHTLTAGGQSWSFTAADFGGSIDIGNMMDRAWNIGHVGNIFDCKRDIRSLEENPVYLNAPLVYDEAQIDAFVEEIYAALYVAPQDASVALDMDRPYLLSESSAGQELDRDATRAQIISLLETGEGETQLPLITLNPTLNTNSAIESMELIVEYRTDTSFRDANSTYNVRKALNVFSGQTIYPGQTVDFNEWVGPREEGRGWYQATEFEGNTTVKGWGGGVCQASSTLYGAMLKAGMTIILRNPHSMTVPYVEPSIDAAVTSSSKNLIFRNDTDTPIYILTDVTREYAMVKVFGKRPPYRYELESVIVSQDQAAVHISYIPDTEGKYCYYENETKLYKKGKAACSSQGWLIAYDWETGEEVSRTQLSFDQYQSGTDIYWQGIHPLGEVPGGNTDFTFDTQGASDLT